MWVAFNYFKKNEKTVIANLINQDFEHFIPKIAVKHINSIKTENLFPGYGFVRYENNISSLNYTRGVNKVVRFGSVYGLLGDDEINEMKILTSQSLKSPISRRIPVNSEVKITNGPLENILGTLVSYSRENRVVVLYQLLGRNIKSEVEEANLVAL